jgi:chitin disaccharide deacetylase
MLILTADDYGKDAKTTDNILQCSLQKRITSASAMVFMQDSERAASLSKGSELEIGLHLNFTEPFNGSNVSPALRQHQKRIKAYLDITRLTQIICNPFLARSFSLVFQAQQDEFRRIYGKTPDFYNGHHHMHLCMNVILGKLLPAKARIRNTFSFESGEKGIFNLWYRNYLHRLISKRFISTEGFFTIAPVHDLDRLRAIFKRAQTERIEIEVHPEIEEEKNFLLSEKFKTLLNTVQSGKFERLEERKYSGDRSQ